MMISSTATNADLDALWQLFGGKAAEGDGEAFLQLLQGMLEAGLQPEEVAAMLQAGGPEVPGQLAPQLGGQQLGGQQLGGQQLGGQQPQPAGLPLAGEAQTAPLSVEGGWRGPGEALAQPGFGGQPRGRLGEAPAGSVPPAMPGTDSEQLQRRAAADRLWAHLNGLGLRGGLDAGTTAVTAEALRAEALGEFAGRPRGLDEQVLANLQTRLTQLQGQSSSLPQGQTETAAAKADGAAPLAAEATQNAATAARPAAVGAPPPGALPSYTLPVPAGQPGWGQAMGERLSWLVRNGIEHARIRLDPPNLGQVNIAIQVKGEQTSVQISAHTAQAREALEAELPRLRQMLEEGGFAAVDVGVSQRQGGEAAGGRSPFAALLAEDEAEAAEQEQVVELPRRERGLVDHYA